MKLRIKKLTEDAQIPTRANPTDAAYDIFSNEDKTIVKGQVSLVSTGIAIELPEGDEELLFYGRIAPRSGLAVKHGIDVFAGVVDPGYRGEIKIALFNTGIDDYQVTKGDRIAQLLITPVVIPNVEVVQELSDADRGDKGFGSSGK